MNANLYALLHGHFGERAEQPCLLLPGGPVIHYDDLDAWSARLAHVLVDAGCRSGDRVAVQVDKCWQVLALYLACLRAGLVYLPLNTGYLKDELAYFFGDAEPRVIVCRPESAALVAALRPEATVLTLAQDDGTLLERARDAEAAFATAVSAPNDLAAILYTSGTTGRAKGAMLTHRNLASNALTLVEHWSFTRDDVLLHALPIYHVHGLFVACHCALLSGSRMLWLPRFDAREVIELLPHASVMMGVPTFYTRLLAEETFGAAQCRTMRLFISGSAPLLAETFDAFRARTGHTILERYGMTETGKELPRDEIGMIEVKGPNVFRGYWRMPEKTKAEFRPDGFFITGDLGKIDGRGYVHIVGRGKDLIISGGFNVYPKEVESEIDALPGVVESAVIGVPHADFGEGVTAVVVKQSAAKLTEAEVLAALAERLAKFKLPKRVIFVPDLPRNTMGKVQKNALRDQYGGIYKA